MSAIAQPPPAATPCTCAIVGLVTRSSRSSDAVEPLFVLDAVLAVAEALELRDVGAGDERLAAGAAQDQHAERGVGVDAIAGVDERLVHLPRHRVARLGPVEGERGERTVGLEHGVSHSQSPIITQYHDQ